MSKRTGRQQNEPEAGVWSNTIVELKRAVELKPEVAAAHYQLAALYRKTGQPEKSTAEYNEVRRIQSATEKPGPMGASKQ